MRSYRAGRAEGHYSWLAAENGLAQLLPRPAARVLLIEAQMWVCLVRRLARHRPRGEVFTYGRSVRPLMRIVLVLLVVEGVIVEGVLAALLGHSAWVWVALGLHIYGLIWIGGFLGSLHVLPHVIGAGAVRLRDSVFASLAIPLDAIASVAVHMRANATRSGFTLDVATGAALLAYGDATVRIVLRPGSQLRLRGGPAPDGVRTIDVTVDDPRAFVQALETRLSGVPQR